MSDEYISREAAIEEIDKWLDTVGTVLVGKGLSYYGELIGCIEDTPAADVAPVHYAHWEEADWRDYDAQSCEIIREPKAAIVCSDCRCAFKKDALWRRNFCPNCGVKMDGGFDDATS